MNGNARAIAGVPFKPGDVVRLTERYAGTLARRSTRIKVDYHRQGVVQRCDRNAAFVLWDGRASSEYLPVKALEAVPCASLFLLATASTSVALAASLTR